MFVKSSCVSKEGVYNHEEVFLTENEVSQEDFRALPFLERVTAYLKPPINGMNGAPGG